MSDTYVRVTDAIEVPASWRTADRWEGSVYDGQLVDNLPDAARAIDELGSAAVPMFLRSLDWYFVDTYVRDLLLEVLAHVPVTATFEGLLARSTRAHVPKAFEAGAALAPEAALAVLDTHLDAPLAAALRARLLATHPEVVGISRQALPLWVGDDIPKVLAAPPWTQPTPAPVTLTAPSLEPRIHWLDDNEREAWRVDSWSPEPADQYDHYLSANSDWALGFTTGTEERVRPLLADWEAEKFSFYLLQPRVLVGKYELDAYPPVLRLARTKPAVGADLLAPYVSDEVALLMGRWLARSRHYGGLAASWFERHGPAAVTPLIPLALGKPTAAGSTAARALVRLNPDLVRRAGDLLDAREAVDALLSRDPLELVPPNPPRIPRWLDIDVLPDVVDVDRRRRLGRDERENLVRMVAVSDLEDPYPGLALVAAVLDPDSLAEFGWALFCHWHICGAPSKDAWVINAVGYFGNDVIAERLAPLVMRWPTDGMAQRAKRGVDLLARMDAPVGLRELSRIARAAKSTPLRSHATKTLDVVATDRGLLPEQLEDLLVDDLALEDEVVVMRGATYRPRIGAGLELVLHDSAGLPSPLPKPQDDEEKATVTRWNKRRRMAATVLADQARRLEEAMVTQRRWHHADFRTAVVGHPVLRTLASRIVWDLDGTLGILDPLGDLVDSNGGLVMEPTWLRIAHPAITDLGEWRQWMDARDIVQPFAQVEREVSEQNPSIFWGRICSAPTLHALTRRGWHWGPTGRGAVRQSMIRPFGAGGDVILTIEPGVSAVANPASEPDQKIAEIRYQSAKHDELGLFTDLPASARSELARNLAALELRD